MRTACHRALFASLTFALGASSLAAAGCGGDFDPSSRVSGMRVLALRADTPYAAPGSAVHLDALATHPTSPVAWGFGTCVDPRAATALGCIDALDWSTFSVSNDRTSFDLTVPDDAVTAVPLPGRPQATVGAVVVACPGSLSVATPDRSVAASGVLPFECRDENGRLLGTDAYVVGYKRIFARDTDKNANPVIAQVTWDGADWPVDVVQEVQACNTDGHHFKDCDGALRHRVAPVVPASSFEAGVDSFGTSFHEQVVVEYYATEGIFENDVRIANDPETGFVGRSAAIGQTVTMWLVVHDDRGGVDWAERTVRVVP